MPVLAIWLMDGWDSQMEHPRQASLSCTAGPYFQLCTGYFHLDYSANNVSQLSSPSFPHHCPLSSPMTSPLVFQMTRPTPGRPGLQYQHILSPLLHVISGFIPSFLLPSSYAAWLYFFWFIGTVPPKIWMWVNFLKHYFIHVFLTILQQFSFLNESSSNSLSWHSKPFHFL